MRVALALACVAACAVGPDWEPPAPPRVTRYTAGVAQVVHPGAQLADTWWQLFNSQPLDGLVRLALANNQQLEAARANLRRSQWSLRAGAGVFWPQVDLSASATRLRTNAAQFGGASGASQFGGASSAGAGTGVFPLPGGRSEKFSFYTLTGPISYALDVFGGNRRRVEALAAQVDLQCFSLAAAQLTVTGNVVQTAIARAGYAEEIRVTELLVADLKDQVELARVQAHAGTSPYATVLALETQLANTAATLPPLRQQVAQADDLLATLLGYTPAQWRAAPIKLADLALPRDLPVSFPAQLVRQRPDVLVAEATLHTSSANIGVATAAMLPAFSLSGTPGFQSTNLSKLFSFSSFIWSIGGNMLAPIFHGGTLNAQRRAAIEDFNSSLASYRQAVLTALGDVATTLEALVHDAEAVEITRVAFRASADARKLVGINYQTGLVSYLDVIVANTQYRQAMLTYVQARVKRLQDTVALFVALGGGWWNSPTFTCRAG